MCHMHLYSMYLCTMGVPEQVLMGFDAFSAFFCLVNWSWEHGGAACSFVQHLNLLMYLLFVWERGLFVWERGQLYTECQRVYLWFLRFLLGSLSKCWYAKNTFLYFLWIEVLFCYNCTLMLRRNRSIGKISKSSSQK